LDFIANVSAYNQGLIVILKQREDYYDLLQILSNFKVLRVNEPEISLEELFLKLID
jgi:DNA-binding transcriptional regulator WhiA